jgi:ABC-type cobalamin/Fe3+-siderophores transport system ATPase subunit
MTASLNVIEGVDVRLRYPRQRGEALTGVTLTVPQGAICGLFGRNGAGKTSLMALLAGLRRPSGGAVHVFGEDPWENPAVASRVAFGVPPVVEKPYRRQEFSSSGGAFGGPGKNAASAIENWLTDCVSQSLALLHGETNPDLRVRRRDARHARRSPHSLPQDSRALR